MTHAITWDHNYCEHNTNPDEHWCQPSGHITCLDRTGDCRKHCRDDIHNLCEYGWVPCINECDDYGHPRPRPGIEHCVNGHILDLEECNATLFIEEDTIGNGPDEQPFNDGPIEVEWTGEGYQWSYA